MTRPRISGFRLTRAVTVGEHSQLWLADDEETSNRVVVKVANAPLNAPLEALDRQLYTLTALSHHPALVTVHGGGVSDDGQPFMVLEPHLDATLETRAHQEPLQLSDVFPIMIRLASAVEHLHHAGLVHGAIGLEHVLMTGDKSAALAGFSFPGAQRSGRLAPEVMRGGEHTERSDVFGLGAMMWELVGSQHLPVKLQTALAAAVADSPDHRLQTVRDLLTRLNEVERELGLPETPTTRPQSIAPEAAGPRGAAVDLNAETQFRVIDPDTITRLRLHETWEEASLDAQTRLRDPDDTHRPGGASRPVALLADPIAERQGRHAFDPGKLTGTPEMYKPRLVPPPKEEERERTQVSPPPTRELQKPQRQRSVRRDAVVWSLAGVAVMAASVWGIIELIR